MRLRPLPTNMAWAFFFGDSIITLHGHPATFPTRVDAVNAAWGLGLTVNARGFVETTERTEMREILRRYGWRDDDDRLDLLQSEGIGPMELKSRAKIRPGETGALDVTHNLRR